MRADTRLQPCAIMANQEHVREMISGRLDPEYLRQKEAAGWRVAAVEWVRENETPSPDTPARQEIPYGMRIAADCLHLEEDASEVQAMMLMLELIIQETRMPQVAAELNRRGFRTRNGAEWSPVAVFNLLPRLIEMGPRIFSSDEWIERRPRVANA